AQRALLHRADHLVVFARAIGTGPGAQLASDAQILVDEDDAVLGPLVGGAGRADLDASRLLAMQAGAREVHGAAGGAIARLEAVDAVDPHAHRVGAVGVLVGQRGHVPAGVPLLAVDGAGMAAHAEIEVDDEAELLPARTSG